MIALQQQNQRIRISVQADLINTSSAPVDLPRLAGVLMQQLEKAFTIKAGDFDLQLSAQIRIIRNVNQCVFDRLLIQVVDQVTNGNPAEADFKGLRIKLNKSIIPDILEGRNTRTVPHELGHIFGWDHPHARGTYESVNKEAHALEQHLSEPERKHNLMSQTWYVQKAGIPLEQAMYISKWQVRLLLMHIAGEEINVNYHLRRHFFFGKRLLG